MGDTTTGTAEQADEGGQEQQDPTSSQAQPAAGDRGTDTGRDQVDGQEQQVPLEDQVEKWKAMARKHEAASKANADKAKRFDEWQESQKTEQQKADEQLAGLQRERDEALRNAALAQAALTHGLSADDLDLIGGGSPEEIDAKAKRLAERLKAATPERGTSTTPDPRMGRETQPTGTGDWLRDRLKRN